MTNTDTIMQRIADLEVTIENNFYKYFNMNDISLANHDLKKELSKLYKILKKSCSSDEKNIVIFSRLNFQRKLDWLPVITWNIIK